jgi:hypothetical protein
MTRGVWLEKNITVWGFPFLKGERRTMSVDALTVKSLCRAHNSQLSPVDQAAIDAFNALREFHRLGEVRSQPVRRSRKWPWLKYRVDGLALERWAFKTTCSSAVVMPGEVGDWSPPACLVRYALGLEAPPGNVGLAVVGDVGDRLEFKDEQAFAFIRNKVTQAVGGSVFGFRGLTLLCTWDLPVESLLPLELGRAQGRSALWHPNELNRKPENVAVSFDWSGTFTANSALKALRRRYPGVPR